MFFLQLLAVIFVLNFLDIVQPSGNRCAAETKWDYLTFTQYWPQSVCLTSERRCVIPKGVTTWVIHGLWPTSSPKKPCPRVCSCSSVSNHSDRGIKAYEGPCPCSCGSAPFKYSDISGIAQNLRLFWPNIFEKDYDAFWKYEWSKHGTCGMSLKPALNSEFKYFNTALKLASKYNITSLLSSGRITPGKEYKLQSILSALRPLKNPNVLCEQSRGKQFIINVEICLTKTFEQIRCNSWSNTRSCNEHKPVYYPAIEHF